MGEERDLGIRIKMIPPVIDLIPAIGQNRPHKWFTYVYWNCLPRVIRGLVQMCKWTFYHFFLMTVGRSIRT